jgi:predicted Rossmann-fold nucleotide-binding protein
LKREDHPYYGLAREVGGEPACRGFATLTGGGASYGLNIIPPHEQVANQYADQQIEFRHEQYELRI